VKLPSFEDGVSGFEEEVASKKVEVLSSKAEGRGLEGDSHSPHPFRYHLTVLVTLITLIFIVK